MVLYRDQCASPRNKSSRVNINQFRTHMHEPNYSVTEKGCSNAESGHKNNFNLGDGVLLYVLFGILYCGNYDRLSDLLRYTSIFIISYPFSVVMCIDHHSS